MENKKNSDIVLSLSNCNNMYMLFNSKIHHDRRRSATNLDNL